MNEAPVIAAFDLATVTGICWGRVGGKPNLMTWDLTAYSRPWRFAHFMTYTEHFIIKIKPSRIWYEEPMRLAAMSRVGTSDPAVSILRGMIGILEACATRSRIEIKSFTVQAARKHLTGSRTHGRSKSGQNLGKNEVLRVAKMLGVECANDNEGDAFAGWSYACGLANPRIAHLVTPLFAQ